MARLLAEAWDRSVLLQGDDVWQMIRRGWVAPWLPESHDQNRVAAEATAAMASRFAAGGYAVVVDWVIGPWLLGPWRRADGPVHYVVLRPDVETCVRQALQRGPGAMREEAVVRQMHEAFADLGAYEHHAIDPSGLTPGETADEVRRRLDAGDLLLPPG